MAPVVVREVWQDNLEMELSEIKRVLLLHRFVAMDTEFPGHVFPAPRRHYSQLSAADNYLHMKRNVDATQIIQLGLALSDVKGDSCYVWEFNFKDFDKATAVYNVDSIELLERQGIDFQKNREKGIDSLDFSRLIVSSGLLHNSNITWVTFHGAFDFGYLIKILTRKELPLDLMDFMCLVKFFFGFQVFDVKHMINSCDGLHGGLEKVAKTLGVDRVAGKSHQGGSDSLLTLQTLIKLKDVHFYGKMLVDFMLVLYGLEVNVRCLIKPNTSQSIPYVLHPRSCSQKGFRKRDQHLLEGLQCGRWGPRCIPHRLR